MNCSVKFFEHGDLDVAVLGVLLDQVGGYVGASVAPVVTAATGGDADREQTSASNTNSVRERTSMTISITPSSTGLRALRDSTRLPSDRR